MNPNRPRKKQIPLYLMLVVSLALAGIFFRLQQTSTASADTNDVALAETTYPNIVHSRIDTCALCHTSSIPNLNPFGAAYMAQGRFLASSLRAIEAVDSDGDGFTNIREIAALTFPGNPADHPVLPQLPHLPELARQPRLRRPNPVVRRLCRLPRQPKQLPLPNRQLPPRSVPEALRPPVLTCVLR
jgi:hypothetical protein